MSARTWWIGSAIVVFGALLVFFSTEQNAPGLGADRPPAHRDRSVPSTVALGDVDRRVVEMPPPDHSRGEANAFDTIPEHGQAQRTTLHGRVIDVGGSPVGGVAVSRTRPTGRLPDGTLGAPGDDWRVVADAAGRFTAEAVPPCVFRVRDDRFATVLEGYADRSTREVIVVIGRRIPLGGVVVDRTGTPIEGVRVTVDAHVSLPGLDPGGSRLVVPEARSDATGSFRLENVVAVLAAQAQFQAPGFAVAIVAVPDGGDPAMTVQMSRESDNACRITGQVVLEDGSPAVGAFVSTGFLASPTDRKGFFVIDCEPWLSFGVDETAPTIVTAVRAGLRAVARTLPSLRQARASGWPAPIVLRLVGAPLTIGGVVVDEHGDPVPSVLVEPADMAAFGFVPQPGMPAGGGIPQTQEQLAGSSAVETGADGRFELGGLADRSYTIRALQRPSLLSGVSAPVAAGTQNVRIVLDRSQLGTIKGSIVDRDGQGIGGVRVAVSFERTDELVIGNHAVTADDGSFAIGDVTTTPAFLRIEGETIVPELFRRLGPGDDPTGLVLRVACRRRLQVDWGAQLAVGDRLFVVDEHGADLTMMRLTGGAIGEAEYLTCSPGVSEVVAVADAAELAVVRRGDVEVTRVRLQLTKNEVNLIRL